MSADLGKILLFSGIDSAYCLVTSRAEPRAIISAVEGIILIIARQDFSWTRDRPPLSSPSGENDRYVFVRYFLICFVSRVYFWKMLILSPMHFVVCCNDKCQLKEQEQNVRLRGGGWAR